MKLFHNYTFSWQQIGVFKASLLSIGVIAGTYWHDFFSANMTLVAGVAVITTAYIMYVSVKQW